MEMKKLVVNGVAYTVADPDAASIDDTKAGVDAWSGKNIVDRLCPAFSESGAVVTCQPVEGYPLGVVSRIESVQSGSGDPTPGNVRPISGHSAVKLTRNGEAFTLDLGQTVYGGSLDWQTGVLTVDKRCDVFDGVNKKFSVIQKYDNGNIYAYATIDPSRWLEKEMRCSHLRISQTREYGYGYIGVGGESMFAFIQPFADVAAANAWLVEQANNGTPFTMVFVRAEPLTIQLTPREILALSGTNTLHSDTGDTEVTGRADPTAVLEKLTNAIIALGGNI